jgi:tape measure domain-containing protein
MASKQVSEILVRLGIQGLQGLDKLKSSFRELEKSLGPSAATIERARESIIAFGREGRNTEQVIKGQIEALRGLQSQTERGSTAWAELAGDIERFRQASRRTDGEIQVLRQSILSVAAGANQSQQSLRSYIADLGRLRNEATITGSVFSALGGDIAELTARLQQAEAQTTQTGRAFRSVLGQALASTAAGARIQLAALKDEINLQRESMESIDSLAAKERNLKKNKEERAAVEEKLNRALRKQSQLTFQESARAGRETVRSAAAAFADPEFLRNITPEALDKRLGELPNTTAGLNQGLSELSQRLANTTRNTTDYLVVAMQMAGMQRELTAVTQGYAQALLMGIRTGTVAPSARNLQEVITALRAEMSQLDVTTSEGARAYAENASQARALEQQLKGLANAYRHVGDMAAQAATAETSAATARITANYLNRGLVRQQEQAMAELNQRVRAGVAATPLALPAAGETTAAGTGQAISGGARRLTGAIETTFDISGRRMARTIGERSGYYNPPTAATGAAAAVGQSAEAINRANKSYSNLLVNLREVLLSSDKSISSLERQRSAWMALRQAVDPASKQFANSTKKIEALDVKLEKLQTTRRRLTTGQAVQSAGAIISGGIFGGPEGFVGGLGGFAAGFAIPGLGPVGGAFAGAAAGAQLGGLRQAAGAAAEYAAEIRRLRLALQGVVYSFEDYRSALGAIESASQQFNIPILQSTQQFTKLAAAVVGSGGTIKDAENTFKGLSASVLATGGSIQDVNGALVAAAQVFSKGKVSAEELRGQIGERLAGAFALFAESSGKSTKELDADLQAGEVTLAQFVQFVEFSLKKYGRTAQIIADSPEQAGARLDLALKNLQKNIGNALGPSGAAFQDFAARSIRGIDRVINKLIELRAIQPGAGFYQEQVLGKRMSIEELETALLEAGSRETALRKSVVPGLGFMADLLPEIAEATKKVKILEEALVKLRLNEKETNKERKQRQDDEAKAEKEKLGQQYLQAVEQREESLFDARRQREEQIAKIRKDAVEQAAQIERQLGDERRQIERDIERTRREMEFGAGEIDRLRRLAAGEDPEVIEAERKAAEISQRATEDRIKIQEDLLDKELQQQRTIADFQKNTAKQIAEANEGYAKRVGEIQRDFAKASAKIIEEGSGVAAKRITLAAQIVSQVLQRTSLNQQRTQFGLQPIGEPSGFMGGRPVYSGLGSNEVPEQIQRIDANLEQLLRKLSQQTQGRQSSLPARSGIGEQFLSLLGAERGYEDVAGLMPLPIQRMQQQAARPLRMIWQQIQGAMEGVYRATEKEIKKTFKPDPARNQQVLRRIQRTQEAILNWNPLEAQWKETENQMREQKRSRTIPTPASAVASIVKTLLDPIVDRVNEAEKQSARLTPQLGSPEYARIFSANLGSSRDLSFMLSDNEKAIIKKTILDVFKATRAEAFSLPRQFTSAEQKVNTINELSRYESKIEESAASAANSLRSVVRNFPGFYEEVIQEARSAGEAFAEGALRNLGRFRTAPAETEQWLQEQRDRRVKQFSDIFDQPIITPGIESQFEGAMLPGRGFNISRLTRNYGSIASASPGPLGLIAQAIQGAAPTSQMRQQAAEQQTQQVNQNQIERQFTVLSEITQTSRETEKTLKNQSREIELQIKYLSEGHEPAIARELATLQQSYETQKSRLDVQKQALIDQGQNVNAVTEQYNLELKTLETLNQQNQELAIQNERRNKAIQDAQQLRDAVVNPLQQGLTQSFDLLINGTENWGNSLRQIAATVLQDIARQLIQIYVINQAISAISKLFPMPGGTIPVAAVAANGMAFAKNGIQPFAMGGIVNKPTLFKYADGGAGRFGLMGEAGPEAIIPLKRGRDGKLGVAGGGSVAVTVNVDAQGTKVQGDNGQGQQLGRAVAAAVQAELIKQKRPGGLLA